MADKKSEIEYTPEELAEIERILKVVTGPDVPAEPVVKPRPVVKPPVEIPDEDDEFEDSDIEDFESDMPDNLNVETGDDMEEPGSEEDEFEDQVEEEPESSAEEDEILSLSDDDLSIIEDEQIQEPVVEDDIDSSGFDEFSLDEGAEAPARTPDAFSLGEEEEFNIPDLDDVSIKETPDIPEARSEDIPDIDLSDLDAMPEKVEVGPEPEEIAGTDDDFFSEDTAEPSLPVDDKQKTGSPLDEIDSFSHDFEDVIDLTDSAVPSTPIDETGIDAVTDDSPPVQVKNAASSADTGMDEDSFKIEPLDDEGIDHLIESETHPKKEKRGSAKSDGNIELTERDLGRLKKAIILFNPAVRQAIKDTVINDRLSADDTKKLVEMIITGKSEDSIHGYLEKKLKTKIELVDESYPGRKVLTSRPEYSLEGRARQKKLLKMTNIFLVSTLVAFIVTILSYQYVYKPYMAKKLIHEGTALIISGGIEGGRIDRKQKYDEAEKIFHEVDEEYIRDYLYGYQEYARAYLENKDHREALDKLNKAYNLDKTNIDTLNALGYFYAVSSDYFESVKGYIQSWYFGSKKEIQDIKSGLDLAINFYRRVLILDNHNTKAMYGIGNAYFSQQQYLKAKKYYEDILSVDSDSVIGYSGLLNLYIERDSFPLVATVHAELREKKMLAEIPSPLLSKLAGYYLDKRAKGDSSVRIDYGVTSSKLRDANDNTYPVVMEVLHALNDRDPDYPQLHIQFARYHLAQHNLYEMKRYLEKAIDLSPKYYSALHLLGEFYYRSKEPVKAYKFLKEAIENYKFQPKFTREDFYRETESIGKTNAFIGNIFYYYFDKVKSRDEGLDGEMLDKESEKMANYLIALRYYITAVNQQYESSELNYNMGRIYYLRHDFTPALDRWLHLYDDFVKSPELMLALGNAFYRSGRGDEHGNYSAAKGEYLKLISVLEYEADKIRNINLTVVSHIKVYQSLSSAYNNLGAVYQNLGEYEKRDIAYWKSIDFAHKLGRENEYARVNLARSHRNAEPLLDDTIPFSIDIYREDMRD